MATTYSIIGPFLKVFRDGDDMDFHDLRVNVKFADVNEVVTITFGQSNKKFEIPYASFYPALSGVGAFTTLLNAQVAQNITSATWGYDDSTLNDVLIIAKSDGSVSYESPIGNPYTPTGTILPIQRKARNFSGLVSTIATGAGSTTAGAHRVIFTWDGTTTPTINGVPQPSAVGTASTQKIFDATILGDGQYVGLPEISFDGSAGSIVVDQLFL